MTVKAREYRVYEVELAAYEVDHLKKFVRAFGIDEGTPDEDEAAVLKVLLNYAWLAHEQIAKERARTRKLREQDEEQESLQDFLAHQGEVCHAP